MLKLDCLSIALSPICFVKTDFAGEDHRDLPIEELGADIEILYKYADNLEGIDGFSHLLVFFHLHKIPAENRKW